MVVFVQSKKLIVAQSSVAMLQIGLLMQMFEGDLEHKVMSKSGCLNYITTAWEPVNCDVFERHTSYKFNHSISVFGGEVTCTQQKISLSTGDSWIVNEIMTLHGVPFGDHFCLSKVCIAVATFPFKERGRERNRK